MSSTQQAWIPVPGKSMESGVITDVDGGAELGLSALHRVRRIRLPP
ncbi:hypothetical protein [Nocardiopsis oceani]